jgi:hypothetical protein
MGVQNVTTDYTDRQIDLELLQTILAPVGSKRMTISTVKTPPKVVTGVQKAVQRYALLFLTSQGDSVYAPAQGTQFREALTVGAISNRNSVQRYFTTANLAVMQQLKVEDEQQDIFGRLPDDERIVAVQLLNFDVDYATSTVLLVVQITTQAGEVVDYVLPATTIR